ncbi:hypothetical protein [Hydrogenovibrio marinus]|nr:hypothetical protein [Hydrogenovibrio marinus]
MIEYALVAAAVVALGVAFFGKDGKTGTIGDALTTKMTNVATDIKGS